MKLFLAIFTFSFVSVAQLAPVKTYYCESSNPTGSMYLKLDEKPQGSIARISNPFTQNLKILRQENPPASQYTKLFIDHVKLERTDSGRPFCNDCYTFNANVYRLSKNQEVLEATKHILSRVRASNGEVVTRLEFFIGYNKYLNFYCERL